MEVEKAEAFHEPVMVEEVLEVLKGANGGTILDGTLGGGGHTEAMLSRWPECRVIGVDRDPEAVQAARKRLQPFSDRLRVLEMRFDHAMDDAQMNQEGLDGALLDLGVSSWQLDADHRGFAFRRGLPLDMRMNAAGGGITAADFLNRTEEHEMARVFREYGEEPRARGLAREIGRRRGGRPFRTSDDLVAAFSGVLGRTPRPREMARVFQALRIVVNQELPVLSQTLPRIRDALRPQGVLVVISYHSLEDRIVKNSFRDWSSDCVCPPGLPVCVCDQVPHGAPLFRKPQRPSEEEIQRNPRSRSSLMRAWRKAA
ncbi:MAG: 16S rRNA (cytosine(1402)-N(4))-methyltransferase RsmH [Gemmatimonadetes bacterium]|nr:16S rRNA (cytosine(1402)-N(4))-methyltransferase RsmH [Gemmatimonadota bacterium]NNM06330.1 16S rRNA (cytosine(1402)-N(4))-methyltransferase RsmH [Gemmatimonadota bacterium]